MSYTRLYRRLLHHGSPFVQDVSGEYYSLREYLDRGKVAPLVRLSNNFANRYELYEHLLMFIDWCPVLILPLGDIRGES